MREVAPGLLNWEASHPPRLKNWSSYRSTPEALKHEKCLYLAEAGLSAHQVSGSRFSPTASRG